MTIKDLKEELYKIPDKYNDMELEVCIEDSDVIDELMYKILGKDFVNNAEEGTDDGEKVNELFCKLCSILITPMKSIQYREDLFNHGFGKMLIVGDSYFND